MADEPMTVTHLLGPAPEAEALEVKLNLGGTLRAGHGLRFGESPAGHDLANADARRRLPGLIRNETSPRPEPQPTLAIAQNGIDDILKRGLAEANALEGLTVVLQDAAAASPNPQTFLLRVGQQGHNAIGGQVALVNRKLAHLLGLVGNGEKAVRGSHPNRVLVLA